MELFETIKEIAVEAAVAGQSCDIMTGIIDSVSPVTVKVSQKLTLSESQIVFTESVTEHTVKMTADEVIDGVTKTVTKDYIVHADLQTGDEVILARSEGGQVYYVLGRVGKKGVYVT